MVNSIYEMDTEPRKPEEFDYIPENLPVFDTNGKKVGTVKYFQAPSTSDNPNLSKFPLDLRNSSMPDEVIYRMLNAGFICVDAGLLAKDRFVFLRQINQVRNGEVYLDVSVHDLIKA